MRSLRFIQGQISIQLLIFTAVTLVAITGFVVWSFSTLNSSVRELRKTQAFAIAESGVEYYRWHLAHASTDYWDGHGATSTGPYVHLFYDKDGNQIGAFALTITPPTPSSTIVTIQSAGSLLTDSSIQKIIRVRLGIPSLAKYAVGSNDNVRFGAGTVVYGPITSNGGIHFDGVAHNLVASALTTYTDPDYGPPPEYAVYTLVSPADPYPPATLPNRPDVFMAGRQLGVPALDFNGITQTLSQIKSAAITNGIYRGTSTVFGYDVALNSTGTVSIFKVTALTAPPQNCTNSQGQSGWGTWSVSNEALLGTYPVPTSGLLFFEDNIWVRGQINHERLTIASGAFPVGIATSTSITVNSNLLYTNYDGSDSIGLIAQNNINTGLSSADTLRIDGALTAQSGRVGRYYYDSNCGTGYVRTGLTLYGMIASYVRYGFAYTDNTGYQTRNISYDSNLLYGPPPSYPLVGSQYTPISWSEVQ